MTQTQKQKNKSKADKMIIDCIQNNMSRSKDDAF
jgi:hypothetical protein